MGTRRWRPFWGFDQRRHESRTNRNAPSWFRGRGAFRIAARCSTACRPEGRRTSPLDVFAHLLSPFGPHMPVGAEPAQEPKRLGPLPFRRPAKAAGVRSRDAIQLRGSEGTNPSPCPPSTPPFRAWPEPVRAVSRRGCRPGLTTQARLKNPDVAGIGGHRRTGCPTSPDRSAQ